MIIVIVASVQASVQACACACEKIMLICYIGFILILMIVIIAIINVDHRACPVRQIQGCGCCWGTGRVSRVTLSRAQTLVDRT